MSVPDQLKIQFSSAFTLFLVWLVFDFVGQFTTLRTTKSDTVENGTANASATATTDGSTSFAGKASGASHLLFKSFVLLSIGVFFNYFLAGNKASGDTFSLIALFSSVLGAGSHLFGVGVAAKGFWILFTLSIFAILVTAFASSFSSLGDLFHF